MLPLLLFFAICNSVIAKETNLMELLSNTSTLQIAYANKEVKNGNDLTPTEAKNQPLVNWKHDDSYYTLALADIDYVNENEERQQILHWLVGNIQGDDVENGEDIAGYLGAGPPLYAGYHRYVFLVYKQNGNLTFDEEIINSKSVQGRTDFNFKEFSEKYQLGDAKFGNYFNAKYDDYVPELRQQLSD